MDGSLKYFVVLSTALHTGVLAFFGFTFSPARVAAPRLVYLPNISLPVSSIPAAGTSGGKARELSSQLLPKTVRESPRPSQPAKPAVLEAFSPLKPLFPAPAARNPAARKDATVMIHPLLPYQLHLYFKDRQSVHIELAFKIVKSRSRTHVIIRRKVSSGNLDADLLCCRYLGHYLYIQEARFVPNTWQMVKIDLSEDGGER